MSLTALLWVTLYCAAIVFSFANPLFGSLGYLLEYYMRPSLKWWGDALPELRYNLIISVAFGAAFLLRRSSLREMVRVPNPALRFMLGLGAIMLLVTSSVAVDQSSHPVMNLTLERHRGLDDSGAFVDTGAVPLCGSESPTIQHHRPVGRRTPANDRRGQPELALLQERGARQPARRHSDPRWPRSIWKTPESIRAGPSSSSLWDARVRAGARFPLPGHPLRVGVLCSRGMLS